MLVDLLSRGTIQTRYRTDIGRLLARVGVDDAYLSGYHESRPPALPAGAVDYLTQTNPRLHELRELYERSSCGALDYSQWSPQYVALDVPFLSFRGDCAFMWQKRDFNTPLSYVATYYYLRVAASAALMDALLEDVLFGAYCVWTSGECLTRDRLDSVAEIAFLDKHLCVRGMSHARILDIGSGYGRLAYRLTQAFDSVEVVCVDAIPEASFICEYYIRFRQACRAAVVPLPELDDYLTSHPIDIAISVHSLTECPLTAVTWWVELLRRHAIKYLMIVPDCRSVCGDSMLSREFDGSRRDITTVLRDCGYRVLVNSAKFEDGALQAFGVSPTTYFLFGNANPHQL